MLTFFARTSGTWINVATILIGTGLGLLLRHRLPPPLQRIITQSVGLLTLVLGMRMAMGLFTVEAGPVDGVILGLFALVGGGLLGEWAQVETRLMAVGDWLKAQVKGGGRFTEGWVAASLLFCIGPMAILGSLENGLTGSNGVLVLKAVMDGFAAIALTSTYGIGVGFSTLSIALYQGSLSLLASLLATALPDPAAAPPVILTTGVGGLMIIALGLTLLEVATLPIASFLPALLLSPLLVTLALAWLG